MRIDRRLVFLERAAARLTLYHEGAMDPQEAVAGLEPLMLEITNCSCYWATFDAITRRHRRKRKVAA